LKNKKTVRIAAGIITFLTLVVSICAVLAVMGSEALSDLLGFF